MHALKMLGLSCALCSAANGTAQTVYAGQWDTTMFHVDHGTGLEVTIPGMGNANHGQEDLDLDYDGVLDVRFYSYRYFSGAGTEYYHSVEGLSPAVTIAAFIDTVPWTYPPDTLPVTIADSLAFGAAVDNTLEYVDIFEPIFFYSYVTSGTWGPHLPGWHSTGPHFVGVRIENQGTVRYGWVKVEVSGNALGVLRILEQGCTYAEWTILVPSVAPHSVALSLVPQPFTNEVTVATEDHEPMELVLFDLAARPVLRSRIAGTTTIATTHLAEGMYVFELKKSGSLIKQGRIVKH